MAEIYLMRGLFDDQIFNPRENLEFVSFKDIDGVCDKLEERERYFELELLRYYQLNTVEAKGGILPSMVYVSLKEDDIIAGFDSICFSAYISDCEEYKNFFLARSDFAGSILYLIIEEPRKEQGEVKLSGDYKISTYTFSDLYHGISVDSRRLGVKRKAMSEVKQALAKFYGWSKPKNYVHMIKGDE